MNISARAQAITALQQAMSINAEQAILILANIKKDVVSTIRVN